MNRRNFLAGTASVAGALATRVAHAMASTVKLVYPYTPGSGGDILARVLADDIGKRLDITALVENKPGALNSVLAPLAEAGADLQVVMGYHYHGEGGRAVIEVCPVSGKKTTTAASKAGLAASDIPTLLVQGDNRPGMGHAIAQAIAEAGISLYPDSTTGTGSADQKKIC